MSSVRNELRVRLAQTDEERLEAMSLLLSDRVIGQETASLLQSVQRIEGVMMATAGGEVVGASWLLQPAGSAALLVPPVTTERAPAGTGYRLLTAATSWAAENDCRRVQAFVLNDAAGMEDLLTEFGFHAGPRLHYMAGEADQIAATGSGPVAEWTGELQWSRYDSTMRARMEQVVEQTYIDSLDCPETPDRQSPQEALDNYLAAGESGARHWWILRRGERDVGCLILADHPVYRQLELLYMGIVPSCRGRGWGILVSRGARHIAAALGRDRVVLAVDHGNSPALQTYEKAGYRITETRRLYLWNCRP